jgi:acyl-CoA synthetase
MSNTMLTLLSAAAIDQYTRAGFWGDETIYAVAARHARMTPDAPAVRDAAGWLSYRALVDTADRLARDMAGRGVRMGQRVAVWLPSRAETAVALLACSRNGYVCCLSLHRDHTAADIVALCHRMRAVILIAQPGYGADRADVFALAEGVPSLLHAYRLAPAARGDVRPLDGLLDAAAGVDRVPNDDPNQVIYLPFTSGTTGLPKGVMHSDNTLLANARVMASDWAFGPESVTYTMSPLSHNLGLGALITSIVAGGELVVHDIPRGASLYDRLVETGATFLFGVPTHAIDLLTELRARGATRLGRVSGFRISGAAATAEVIRDLMRYGVMPQSGYGMTETCSHQYTLPTDDAADIAGTSGRACPGYEVKIWRQDDPDREAAVGEFGQIGGRGASLMLGYFDDQAATEESFNAAGWFLTGDLGTMDERGFLRIVGRKKDLIIRGGHNIYPAHIEALAMRHAAVDKVAAFPVPDARLGEKVCLAVVARAGQMVDDGALFAHLEAAGLSRYDMPEFLLTMEALPMTASGKIVKRELAQMVADGVLTPRAVRFVAAGAAAGADA